MSLSIGLDFGTSNSGLAVFDGQTVNILALDPKNTLPQVVKTVLYITRDHNCFFGQEAIELYYRDNVNRQRRYVKKWAGEIDYHGADLHYVRDIFVLVDELKPGRLLQYLKTALRREGYQGTEIFDRFYSTGNLIQIYLKLLKNRAEEQLGQTISNVWMGRPVLFSENPELDQNAKNTLRQAALEAGFKKIDFELEPLAAALYYEKGIDSPQNVVVFDFGGGTLDIAVLRLGDPRGRKIFASRGVDIAGSDFDRKIIEKRMLPYFGLGKVNHQPELLEMIQALPDWMALPELGTPQNRNILENAIRKGIAPVRLRALEALIYNDLAFTFYNRVESAKISLSDQGVTLISMEDKNVPLWELYTRIQFEADILEYEDQIEKTLAETLASAGLEIGQVDAVVKTGGSSNIPFFNGMLARIFGSDKVKSTDAFSSVAAGLAIRSGNGWQA